MEQAPEQVLRTAVAAYRIFDLVAAGAFGSVYYGRNLADNEPVAVKLLHPHHAGDPRVVVKFEQEAATVRGLAHPNIVQVLDQGRTLQGIPFIVMEWVTGWTIAALVERRGPFPPGEAMAIGCQVLAGLEAARLRGVVHRDIKPLNLMVTATGQVKVMDFGIAKESTLATAAGASGVIGTPAYMAPEQFREEPLDSRTDLYALGVTLYQMLAGELPFQATTLNGYMYQHLNSAPPPLVATRPGLDSRLADVVQRALEKSPAARWPTPAQMQAALQPFATQPVRRPDTSPPGPPLDRTVVEALPGLSTPIPPGALTPTSAGRRPAVAAPPPAWPAPTAAPRRSARRAWALVAAASLIMVLGAFLVLNRLSGPAPGPGPTPSATISPPTNTPVGPPVAGAGCQPGLREVDALLAGKAWTEAATKLEPLRTQGCDVVVPFYTANLNHGLALAEDERTDEAIDFFGRALQAKPSGNEALRERDLALAYKTGRDAINRRAWSTAVDQLGRVYQARSDYAHGNIQLHLINAQLGSGDELLAQQKPCDAQAAFQQAAAIKPADPGITTRLTRARNGCSAPTVVTLTPTLTAAPARPPDMEAFVRRYYQSINDRDYANAYAVLSREAQRGISLADFSRQFSETLISIQVRFVDGVNLGGNGGSLAAHTTTVSKGTPPVRQCWRVNWQLGLEDGQWKREQLAQTAESC